METKIIKGNKLIVEFMGAHPGRDSIGKLWYLPDDNPILIYANSKEPYWLNPIREPFNYHTSWDWLMPVVEKINKLSSDYPRATSIVWENGITTPIDKMWNNIIEFINWYNTHPNEK